MPDTNKDKKLREKIDDVIWDIETEGYKIDEHYIPEDEQKKAVDKLMQLFSKETEKRVREAKLSLISDAERGYNMAIEDCRAVLTELFGVKEGEK